MTTKERNKEYIGELLPQVQYAALAWDEDCRNENCEIKISEAYRTQDRQRELYAQGRTKSGKIVTYTLNSEHTMRLALDVYAANGKSDTLFYSKIAMIGKKYGIEEPYMVGFIDKPHFSFSNVSPKPAAVPPADATMAQNVAKRAVARLKKRLATLSPLAAERAIARLKKRYPNAAI